MLVKAYKAKMSCNQGIIDCAMYTCVCSWSIHLFLMIKSPWYNKTNIFII